MECGDRHASAEGTCTHVHICSRMHARSCAKAPKLGLQRVPKRGNLKLLCRTLGGKDIDKTHVMMDPVLGFNFGLACVETLHAWWGMYCCANSLRYRFGDSVWQTGNYA